MNSTRGFLAGFSALRRFALVVCTLPLVSGALAAAQDQVRLRGDQGAQEQVVAGTIVGYTSRELRIDQGAGIVRSFAGERVLNIQTEWVPTMLEARRAVAENDYNRAIRLFFDANGRESRVWVKQLIISELTEAYAASGRVAEAGDTFLILCASEPETPYFHQIPLAWVPREDVPQAKAQGWLTQPDSPVAALLGASHLVSTDARPQASEVLNRLVQHADGGIAALAEAQLWRTRIAQSELATVAQWERRIDLMPEALQPGPLLTLSRAWAQHGRWEEAAQAALRASLLHPQPRGLASEAYLAAGEALRQAGREKDASKILGETVALFRGMPAARAADASLRQINSNATGGAQTLSPN